jgi:outer membrane protein assembly factor BamB
MIVAPVDSTAHAEESRTAPGSGDWPVVGGGVENMRYSALVGIDKVNLDRLGIAWVSVPFEDEELFRAPVVVKGGLLFVSEGRYVYAMSAKSGRHVWRYDMASDASSHIELEHQRSISSRDEREPRYRAISASQELVYVGLQGGRIFALNAKTGVRVWKHHVGGSEFSKVEPTSITLMSDQGVVIVGLGARDGNQRGSITALDAATGKRRWQTFTVPMPGEPAYRTWRSIGDRRGLGGGGFPTDFAIDAELGMVYVMTGGAAPAYGGDLRAGVNLYTSSVLGVDIKTGQIKWHHQLIRHDVFPGDPGTSVVLYNARDKSGRVRKALAVMRADGFLFLLDRLTGTPLLTIEERPVPQLLSQRTAKTQPYPVIGESLLMSCEDWRKEQVPTHFTVECMFTPPASPPPSTDPQNVLAPAPTAARSSLAYSPRLGYFYAYAVSRLHWPRRSQDPYFTKEVGVVPGLREYGELAAIDGATGRIVWRRRLPASSSVNQLLATAGGLVFRHSGDGLLEAFDELTGDVLWQHRSGWVGGPIASYEVDGEQYLAQTMQGAVWAFKVGGTSPAPASAVNVNQDRESFAPLMETDEIETSALHVSESVAGTRYFIDEFSFSPARVRVRAGRKILFVNNGSLSHEVVALDDSWSTGRLSPSEEAWITFERPGKHAYICKDHPWSYGELTVLPPESRAISDNHSLLTRSESESTSILERSGRGKEYFQRSCSVCHGEDLAGRGAAVALSGEPFRARWRKKTVGGLFDNIRSTMPLSSPGSLSRETYLDLAAYLLRSNDALLMQGELKDEPAELGKINIEFARRED